MKELQSELLSNLTIPEDEDFEFDEGDFTETINGEKITFEEVKRNGFDYIKITAIDELDTKRVICELELA